VTKVHDWLAVETSSTRAEVMKFVWIIGIKICNKMIPEKVFNTSFIMSTGKIIGREFQSQQIQLNWK